MPEYTLTDDFCRKHFLIGILLREVGLALQEDQDIRHLALTALKNIMAKHSFDNRYSDKVIISWCCLWICDPSLSQSIIYRYSVLSFIVKM